MKIRVDYHFHPNLSNNDAKAGDKCRLLWQKFRHKNINTVVITEHAYKNPKRAFMLMNKYKPESSFCFPGIECVTKEGIDIVVFSDNEQIYSYGALKTFGASYFELIKFVNSKKDLYAYVTHPYTLGLTSVLNKLGRKSYLRALELLKAVEVSNGAFDNLFLLLTTFPLRIFFRSKIRKINDTKRLPKSDYPLKINFLAAGSDAHHMEEIGNCYELISVSKNIDEKNVFKSVTTNRGKGRVVFGGLKNFNLYLLLKSAFTTLTEFFTKQTLKIGK